jgi:serine/threonine protein kinase
MESTAVPADRFVRSLTDFELITSAEAEQLSRQPRDPKELARELIKRQKLTRFQAGMLLQGKTVALDNYLLIDPLGEGGMGQVFKARHRGLNRIVALKILSPAVTRNETALKRFQREVRAAAKLNHPNIVAARDAGQANGIHFLVMECVNGSDLSRWVKTNGPMPVPQAVDCIKQAATGLAHAHAAGIIHRDIKPSNLIAVGSEQWAVNSKGKGTSSLPTAHCPLPTVKILDMGLARIDAEAGNETASDELTKTGSIMGTSDYMAPEQALNAKLADHRADIYSLGCTLYFLLTGKPAFAGETAMEKVFAHREQPIPQLPAESRHLQPVLARMMAKKPEQRYASMNEVIAALESPGTESRRRRLLPLFLIGGAVAAAAVLVALSLGGDAKPSTVPQPVLATQAAPVAVLPTAMVQVPPDRMKAHDGGKGQFGGGGLKLNQKLAGKDSPTGKDGGVQWQGGPPAKLERPLERMREIQKAEVELQRAADQIQRQPQPKPGENPSPPPPPLR